jgi:uncharacterized membrane protein YgcG
VVGRATLIVVLAIVLVAGAIYFELIHPRLFRRGIARRDRAAIDRAVVAAEERTGLQFCVYLGPAAADARAHAEQLFVDAGLHERPAVLLLVAPDHRRVEVVTAPDVKARLTDEACARAIDGMTPLFAQSRFVDGLSTGIGTLADEAGPGQATGADLPNIVEE